MSHILKTTTAGQTWTNLTSNLPDAPVDSIAIDPDDANVLYLGTDLGAFISTDGGSSWQILGTGLPNVPVTKIRVFGSNAAQPKLLRISTYGRGLWQFALPLPQPADFAVAASGAASVTVNAGQSAAYTLDVTGLNGFSGSVSLTCTAGLPTAASCSFSPSAVTISGTAASSAALTISTTARSRPS